MKTIKPKKNGIFSMLLALLGVSATSCIVPCMYGTPNADWTVKGKVVDEAGKPVAGLQVVLGNQYENSEQVVYDQNYWPLDTLQTGSDGVYTVDQNGFPLNYLRIDVHDIDGEAGGGEFADASLIVRDFKFEDGKGWYEGHANINVPDIIVHKKQ